MNDIYKPLKDFLVDFFTTMWWNNILCGDRSVQKTQELHNAAKSRCGSEKFTKIT